MLTLYNCRLEGEETTLVSFNHWGLRLSGQPLSSRAGVLLPAVAPSCAPALLSERNPSAPPQLSQELTDGLSSWTAALSQEANRASSTVSTFSLWDDSREGPGMPCPPIFSLFAWELSGGQPVWGLDPRTACRHFHASHSCLSQNGAWPCPHVGQGGWGRERKRGRGPAGRSQCPHLIPYLAAVVALPLSQSRPAQPSLHWQKKLPMRSWHTWVPSLLQGFGEHWSGRSGMKGRRKLS